MNPKLRYQTSKSKRPQNIHELIARYERTASCYCRKYKCKYIQLNVKMGEQPVRIFIIKYGRSPHWKVLLTTDTSMNFVRAFELYERRWDIEVIFKECRGYLWTGKMSEPKLQRSDCRHNPVFHDVPDALLGQTLFRIRNPGCALPLGA